LPAAVFILGEVKTMYPRFLRVTIAACAGLFAILATASCASHDDASLPNAVSYARSQGIAPARRGKITLYGDTFGDPVPTGITAGPDGALWFTDPGNDVIGRITTAGTYTLEQPVGTELSDGITVGPDKNLWFTLELEQGGVGFITTSGNVKLFHDRGGSYTQGITTGPDGALWFTESNGKVGRRTLKGKVKHFTLSSSDAHLQGIVTGPDHNLWVTQQAVGSHSSNVVYRLTRRGKVTAFSVGFFPSAICVGPDGALWFAEAGSNSIGRLTTGGSYTSYPTTDPNGFPFGIAAGPDGALWFTDSSKEYGIGRITTSGNVHLYKAQVSFPQFGYIAAGPDGAMWFTATDPPAIGRVTTRRP
jgi:virginiamycin B lyase